MHRVMSYAVIVPLVLLMAVAACAGKKVPNEVFVASSGVTIEGEGFTLREGEASALPFVIGAEKVEDDMDIVESYEAFRDKGAREVRVTVPGASQTLYGLLSLHELPESARGPASRSLSVKIPPSQVNAASDGRISVVFEPVEADDDSYFGWILWMSDRPF